MDGNISMPFMMRNHEYIEMESSSSTFYDIKRELHDELENIIIELEYITDQVSDSLRMNETVWTLFDKVVERINQIKKSILMKTFCKNP